MNSLDEINRINTPEVSEKILRRAVALNLGGSTPDAPKSVEKGFKIRWHGRVILTGCADPAEG